MNMLKISILWTDYKIKLGERRSINFLAKTKTIKYIMKIKLLLNCIVTLHYIIGQNSCSVYFCLK